MRQYVSLILDVPKYSLKLYDLTHSLKSLKLASHWHALGAVLHCLCIKIDEPQFYSYPKSSKHRSQPFTSLAGKHTALINKEQCSKHNRLMNKESLECLTEVRTDTLHLTTIRQWAERFLARDSLSQWHNRSHLECWCLHQTPHESSSNKSTEEE